MLHFAEHSWADFVRGVSNPEISQYLKAHLATGCAKCHTLNNRWGRVQRVVAVESTYAPPENLVRLVKLGFDSRPASQQREPARSKWTLATLVFDSFTQPLPAAVRSGGALNVWQVIYEAEGLTVDLRFGRRAQSTDVHLVGQVLEKREVRALQDNACVELSTAEEQLIATAVIGALGEFHLEFEAREDLWLSVKAEDRRAVRIPLTNPR
jgi:hypothetical protein